MDYQLPQGSTHTLKKNYFSENWRFESDIAHIPARLDFPAATGTQTITTSKCASIISDFFMQPNDSIPKRHNSIRLYF